VAAQLGLLQGPSGRVPPPSSPGKRGGLPPAPAPARQQGSRRFVLPVGECEFMIEGVLEELQVDAFRGVADQRPARCTGTALQV
jgi:protein transport protein SEC23